MVGYIFISYSHENRKFTSKLARRLQSQGISVWLDQWNISQDEPWNRSIVKALRESRQVLLILSPEAVNSWVVRDQVLLALRDGKQIIPIVYRPCQIPSTLHDLPVIDFTGSDEKNALSQLFSHYFPENQFRSRSWSLPKINWSNLVRDSLAKLLPLLWPGWLGPTVVIALLIIITLYSWTTNRHSRFSPEPASERLAIVQPTSIPSAQSISIGAKVRTWDGQIMVAVPAGQFLMGSSDSDPLASDDEKPQRLIYLDAYWIDKTEITNAQYGLCIEAGHCTPPHAQPTTFREDPLPVVGVDWNQAGAYCEWVGGRLPTEAEWEKAARGTDGRIYPWGDIFDRDRLNYCDVNCTADWRDFGGDDGYNYTAPVGSFPSGASPYGVLDMSGNVWEWVADWYDAEAYTEVSNQSPTGPETGLQRVIRGGSWYYQGRNLRVVNRHKDVPTASHDNIGFRCVIPDNRERARS